MWGKCSPRKLRRCSKRFGAFCSEVKKIDLGPSGGKPKHHSTKWRDLDLATPWPQIVNTFAPDTDPTDIQVEVLGRLKALSSRRNLIVSSPTNSGKSLLGYLIL